MSRQGSTETDDIDARYNEVIRADEEIKSLYLSWSDTLRAVNNTPNDNPSTDGLPTGLMPAMLLMSIAQKEVIIGDIAVLMTDGFGRSLPFIANFNCRVFATGDTHSL